MDQENTNPKNPYSVIDYREILAQKKGREAQQTQPFDPRMAEKKNFWVGVKNFWILADKKVKIEIIILLVSLLLSIVFLSLIIRSATKPMVNKNPVEAPPLEILNQPSK
jgi:hypothetical protein